MMVGGFFHIAVDTEINTEDLFRRMKKASILPFNMGTNFNSQVLSIWKRYSTVLWTRCKPEESIGVGRAPVMIEPAAGTGLPTRI